jgi:Fe-Mn family superoxide dismutase
MFILMQLPYSTDALEPHIDTQTLETHYGKHHAGYVKKLNAALEDQKDLLEMDLEVLLTSLDKVPANLQKAVVNNGGQVYNHNLYWNSMNPNGGGVPTGSIAEAIDSEFGSFENFKEELSNTAATTFGSGWAWLSVDTSGKLEISSSSNADSPLLHGKTPILTIDVWEHAYYLKYKNLRPDYISAFWEVVDWESAEARYQAAK